MQDTPAIKATYEVEVVTMRSAITFISGNLTHKRFENEKRV